MLLGGFGAKPQVLAALASVSLAACGGGTGGRGGGRALLSSAPE